MGIYKSYKDGERKPDIKKPDTVFHKFVVQAGKLKQIKEI